MKYIMALDQGTTSSRCIIFDGSGAPRAMVSREFPQYYPNEGWVEQDANEIWASQIGAAHEAMLKAGAGWSDIAAIGITNQRETAIVWDRKTGEPVYRAIVWQCRRTADYCEALKKDDYADIIKKKTGLVCDPYFSASKVKWILDNVNGAREKAEKGELVFGTVDSWLMYKLSGGAITATDPSNASRTMLFNINTLEWDSELTDFFKIPLSMLCEVKPSSGVFGYSSRDVLGAEIPISGVAGDQQAALFGQGCTEAGELKNTYGTGGFLLMNTGDKPVFDTESGLLTTVAWDIGGRVNYALEGSVFICGAAVQWLRDGLKIIDSAPDSERIAASVPDTGGVYIVPAFTGLGAPYWDPYARGAVFGITRATAAAHIVRAVLESMAFQTCDVVRAMEKASGMKISLLKADGGATANNLLMQMQSDYLGIPVVRPACAETTAAGAAYLAGLGVGFYSSCADILKNRKNGGEFIPEMQKDKREEAFYFWSRAVERTLGWKK